MATTTLGAQSVVTLDDNDISDFVDTITFTDSADALDTTTFGNTAHRVRGGLGTGNAAIGGVYDTTAAGPRDVIRPLKGTNVVLLWQPEGAGSGLPQSSVTVLVREYVESAPVADIVRWTCALDFDGAVTDTNQS